MPEFQHSRIACITFTIKQITIKRFRQIVFFMLLLAGVGSACHTGNIMPPHSTPFFDSAITLSERYYDSGYQQKALQHIRQAHSSNIGLTIEDDMNYYGYCNTIYMKFYNDYDKSIALADSMLWLLDNRGYTQVLPVRVIQAYNIKADALMAKGLYSEAYNNYYKAKQLAGATADSCGLSAYSYSLGMVLYKQHKYEEAASYFKQSYTEAQHCKDGFTYFYLRQELLDNIGLAYGRAKQFDSAMVYYKKALHYIADNSGRFANKKETVYQAAEAVVYGNMADVYSALKQYDTARQLMRRSIAINLQKGFVNSDAELDQVKLGQLLLERNDLDSLPALLADIHAELDSVPSRFVTLQWNKMMWQYYSRKQDSSKAFRYMVAYMNQNDSFDAANRSLMEANIDIGVKNAERQYQIYMLEAGQFRQKIFLIIAVIIALMASAIAVIMIRNSSRTARNLKAVTDLNNTVNDQKEKLEQALQELELKNKDNSRILRSVAHDVMSPIAAIAALTDILITKSENSSEEHKEIFDLIKEACGNSLSLSKDILEAAATIAPGVLVKEWTDINKLVAGSVELLGFRATEKQQHLIVQAPQEHISAFVNKEKIWRVINNLVMNAIKFSYPGSEIHIRLSKEGNNVLFTVADTGIGIPEKNKNTVFDMFTESKMSGTSGEKPNGLGLSISLQIARAHGGNIWFDSVQDKGTTFYFTFPAS